MQIQSTNILISFRSKDFRSESIIFFMKKKRKLNQKPTVYIYTNLNLIPILNTKKKHSVIKIISLTGYRNICVKNFWVEKNIYFEIQYLK